eukprot:739092-Rhodomonas_salina.4
MRVSSPKTTWKLRRGSPGDAGLGRSLFAASASLTRDPHCAAHGQSAQPHQLPDSLDLPCESSRCLTT